MNTLTFAGIFIGGGLGSVLRFSLSLLMGKSNFSLPWATLSANVLSCIIMVLVMKLSESLQLSNSLRLMILTGFCGGL
ncbi:MAG: CrcB family protein, partial [Bacteroidia bacterium]